MDARRAIGSIKDPRGVEARALASSAGRLAAGKCLLRGAGQIRWAVAAGLNLEHVFVHVRHADDPLVAELVAAGVPCLPVGDGIAGKIADTSYVVPHLGVVTLPAELAPEAAPGRFVLVLDHVVDHGNIGTIVRAAGAFGVRDLVLTDPGAELFAPKTIDASRGAVFDARVRRAASGLAAPEELQARGYQVVATSPRARHLQALVPLERKPLALVVGNETTGVSAAVLDRADATVQIPLSGATESLNVGVAAGISMYELRLRLVLLTLAQHIRSILSRELGVTAWRIRWRSRRRCDASPASPGRRSCC
jgi:TrmH family RNA methyltransferase